MKRFLSVALFLFILISTCFAETKEIIAEGTYNMGDGEAPLIVEGRALLQSKKITIGQVVTYIESYLSIKFTISFIQV